MKTSNRNFIFYAVITERLEFIGNYKVAVLNRKCKPLNEDTLFRTAEKHSTYVKCPITKNKIFNEEVFVLKKHPLVRKHETKNYYFRFTN